MPKRKTANSTLLLKVAVLSVLATHASQLDLDGQPPGIHSNSTAVTPNTPIPKPQTNKAERVAPNRSAVPQWIVRQQEIQLPPQANAPQEPIPTIQLAIPSTFDVPTQAGPDVHVDPCSGTLPYPPVIVVEVVRNSPEPTHDALRFTVVNAVPGRAAGPALPR
jgi:hypothetical protein